MTKAHSSEGYLTVQQNIPPEKSNLVIVWEFDYLLWDCEDDEDPQYNIVKAHACDINKLRKGLPHPDSRVTVSCKFHEAPEEVRQEFYEQAKRIKWAARRLSDNDQ